MWRYTNMVVVLLMVECNLVKGLPPLRITIDCGSRPKNPKLHESPDQNDMRKFCDILHHAIPKAVNDGKFVLQEHKHLDGVGERHTDLEGLGNEEMPVSVLPPKGFVGERGSGDYELRRFRPPRVQIPRIPVPILKKSKSGPPPVMRSMIKPTPRFQMPTEEYSSAEKIERLKKGVQKMLHVVKVLGQIDQYLSQRMRIIIDKLSTTFAE